MNTKPSLCFAFIVFLAVACGPAPVYRGSGVTRPGGKWAETPDSGREPMTSLEHRMMREIETWIGTPYKYGGVSRSGVDCSGFTQAVFKAVGIDIPRTAGLQAASAVKVPAGEMRFGDLVFFNTDGSGISHVGIYVGNGFFVHASCGRGVVRESLSKKYYADRIVSVGRYL